MGIMAAVNHNDHQIVVEEPRWTGNITVKYDGRKVSSKNYAFGRRHVIDVTENGQYTHYEISISLPYVNRKVTITRNGVVIFHEREGLVSPPQQTERVQSHSNQREVIVKDVVLVVCPNCTHRNDSSRRTCENCGASI